MHVLIITCLLFLVSVCQPTDVAYESDFLFSDSHLFGLQYRESLSQSKRCKDALLKYSSTRQVCVAVSARDMNNSDPCPHARICVATFRISHFVRLSESCIQACQHPHAKVCGSGRKQEAGLLLDLESKPKNRDQVGSVC